MRIGVTRLALALGLVDLGLGLVVQVCRVAGPVGQHLLRELGDLHSARRSQTADTRSNVGSLVVGVQRNKVAQFAVDDPLDDALAVLALDLEPLAASLLLFPIGQRAIGAGDLQLLVLPLVADSHAVANSEAEVAQKHRNSPVSVLVAVNPRLHDHNRKRVREELVRHIRRAVLVLLLHGLLALLPAEAQCVAHMSTASLARGGRSCELITTRVAHPCSRCVRHGGSARTQGSDRRCVGAGPLLIGSVLPLVFGRRDTTKAVVKKLVVVRLVLVVSTVLVAVGVTGVASCNALLLRVEEFRLLEVAVDGLAIRLLDVGMDRGGLNFPQAAGSAAAGDSSVSTLLLHSFAVLQLLVTGLQVLAALLNGTVLVCALLALAAASDLEGSAVSGGRRGWDVGVLLAMELEKSARREKRTGVATSLTYLKMHDSRGQGNVGSRARGLLLLDTRHLFRRSAELVGLDRLIRSGWSWCAIGIAARSAVGEEGRVVGPLALDGNLRQVLLVHTRAAALGTFLVHRGFLGVAAADTGRHAFLTGAGDLRKVPAELGIGVAVLGLAELVLEAGVWDSGAELMGVELRLVVDGAGVEDLAVFGVEVVTLGHLLHVVHELLVANDMVVALGHCRNRIPILGCRTRRCGGISRWHAEEGAVAVWRTALWAAM